MIKKMSEKPDRLKRKLELFGLDEDESTIYLYLIGKSELSPLVISKEIGISRTKVYAILDKLVAMNLVGEQGEKYSKRYIALPYTQLEQIVLEKRREVEMLESTSESLFEELSAIEVPHTVPTQIQYYRGIDGLKQVTWNSTRAGDTLRIFEAAHDMSAFLDFDFSERVRMEFVKRGLLRSLQLTNYPKISPWTNIEEFVKIWQPRYVSSKELKISTEVVIYNDVVAMYQLHDNDVFCVEIHNSALAEMKKSLFNYVWNRSRVMKKKGERGEAVL